MSHSPNVIFDTILGKLGSGEIKQWQSTFRASDDFYPTQPQSHQWHVYTNAINTLLLGSFARGHTILDWDMFHSKHTYSFLHAAARAVSGSTVYVSDKLGEHDAALIKSMSVAGRALRSQNGPAWPSADSIFVDPLDDAIGKPLFKISNAVGGGSAGESGVVVGIFNFGDPVARVPGAGWVSLDDLNHATAVSAGVDNSKDFAVLFAKTQKVVVVSRNEPVPVVVDSGDAEVVTFAPLLQTGDNFGGAVGTVGLLEKLNGYAAVYQSILKTPETDFASSVTYSAGLWASGVVGIYIENPEKVSAVRVDGKLVATAANSNNAQVSWLSETKILAVDCRANGREEIKDTVVE
ncbi:protein kinase complex component, partial [Physocladia obscura]